MSMDIYGLDPTGETGQHFRSSVWWWHPFWTYCQHIATHLTEGVEGHYNHGDGLDARSATELADILTKEINSGQTLQYQLDREQRVASLPDEICFFCKGTGTWHHGSNWLGRPKQFPCIVFNSKGTKRPHDINYHFDVKNVVRFRDFVATSGGFEIW